MAEQSLLSRMLWGGDARLPAIDSLSKAPAALQRSLSEEVARLGRDADPTVTGNDVLGPGQGIPAVPLDQLLRQARTTQYITGDNNNARPDKHRRVSYETLKTLADTYDILRKAIEIRKSELANLPWDITIRHANRPESQEKLKVSQERIDAVRARFAKPDLRHSYQTWLKRGLEDLFVGDYMSQSLWRSLGGDICGWRWIDGARVLVRMDELGEVPFRPGIAYQQVLWGVPRYDFFEADDPMPYPEALGGWERGSFRNPSAIGTPGELRYRPFVSRNSTLYGLSPVEYFVVHINNALRHQIWESAFWTDGNIPSALIAAPQGWTADQIEEFQRIWDALMSGDQAMQRSLRFIPGGSELQPIDNQLVHASAFANYLIDMTCVAMDVTRLELGFEPEHAANAEAMERQHQRVSLVPLANWLKSEYFDPMIQRDLGEEDLEWVWPSLRAASAREQAEVNEILIRTGQKSIDEVVAENGGTPPGIGRLYATGAQILMQHDLVQATEHGIGSILPGTASFQATQPRQPAEPGQHAGRAPQPENAAPAGTTAPKQTGKAALGDESRAELRRWRTKSLRALKDARSPVVRFETDLVDPETYGRICEALGAAQLVEDVRAAFDEYL